MKYILFTIVLSTSGFMQADSVTFRSDIYHAKPDESQHYLDLESTALHLIDGNFLNADTVERVLSFKREILSIMWGDKRPDGARVGRYSFDGKKVSAYELAHIEHDRAAEIHTDKMLMNQRAECLKNMKQDFLKASNKLKTIARGAKPAMGILIEESCQKRHRMDSVLLLWAHTPEEEEDPIFDNTVKNVHDFGIFCIDLLNFIGDLIYSCPKARTQFEERTQKWKKFEKVLESVLHHQQPDIAFLKWVKVHQLDRLSIDRITTATVTELLADFNKQHGSHS